MTNQMPQGSVPVQQPVPQQSTYAPQVQDLNTQSQTPPQQMPEGSQSNKKGLMVLGLLLVMVLVGGIAAVGYSTGALGGSSKGGSSAEVLGALDSKGFHAIFLAGGQVYFGNIVEKSGDELMVENVHFLQVGSASVQPESVVDAEGNQVPQQATEVPDLSIVNRAKTLHSPTGTVTFNMSNVLFIEELEPDSQVLDAIRQLAEQGDEGEAGQAAPGVPPTAE